jgi:hypothetical protein
MISSPGSGRVALLAEATQEIDHVVVPASQFRLFLLRHLESQGDRLTAARVDRRYRLAQALERELVRLHASLDHRQRRFRARKEMLHRFAPARRFLIRALHDVSKIPARASGSRRPDLQAGEAGQR